MEPVCIYGLMSAAGRLETSRLEMRKTFAEGLGAYRQQMPRKAHFEACLRITPSMTGRRECSWSGSAYCDRLRQGPTGMVSGTTKKSRSDKTTATGLHQGRVRDHFGCSGAAHDTIGFIKSVELMQAPRLALAPTAMTAINDHGLPIRRYRTCRLDRRYGGVQASHTRGAVTSTVAHQGATWMDCRWCVSPEVKRFGPVPASTLDLKARGPEQHAATKL
jgi:hypothetical protein